MGYHQLIQDERYTIARMRSRGKSLREIGRCIARCVSTISREVRRNACPYDGKYRVEKAQSRAMARRWRSRKKSQYSHGEWEEIGQQLQRKWSPQQISGRRRLKKVRAISHETIYRFVRKDGSQAGELWRHMRHMSKPWRKRRCGPATRGRLLGKRHISQRPRRVESRREYGHCEGDTVMGADGRHCVLTLVERKTGKVAVQKMSARTAEQACQALSRAILKFGGKVRTITLDNGTEFQGYKEIERVWGVKIYFATPYRSCERGTNENTNGLLRQYLPKGMDLKDLTQPECNYIEQELNDRPRERLGFRTPDEVAARC
ncbi:IS30 family transposase [Piscinibacter defluvii]|uniref:IS30 family transposase n=1 Tax=Piscinibacter defluvii TaxID=1796922 RepID=UPI000FDD68F5|nr:IS30 family transposase [Piscinibacter defluvii]